MQKQITIELTINGDDDKAFQLQRQIERYAAALPGVMLRKGDKQDNYSSSASHKRSA